MLDTKTKEKTTYITGSNNATYSALMYELDDIELTIRPKRKKKISIKFNKIYSPNIQVNKMTFTDITNVENKNTTTLSIDI